jgi:aryl-alcohol dehydrogenase-like predicted oxidoreductase
VQSLILGTAQWGSAYGVTNEAGRLDDGTLVELIAVAEELGIRGLDTAPVYGDAEERIGRWAGGFAVTSKVAGARGVPVVDQISGSLARLGRASIERCLVHDWPALDHEERAGVVRGLAEARERGLVGVSGVSAYVADDLEACLEHADTLSIAQVPVNILDQRLDGSPVVAELLRHGWTLQARSIFLQGILASPSAAGLGQHPAVQSVAVEAEGRCLTMLGLAAAYVASRDWIDEVVVGVTSATEMRQVTAALRAGPLADAPEWRMLASDDIDLLDPRRWPR